MYFLMLLDLWSVKLKALVITFVIILITKTK